MTAEKFSNARNEREFVGVFSLLLAVAMEEWLGTLDRRGLRFGGGLLMGMAVSSQRIELTSRSSAPGTQRCYAVMLRHDDAQVLLSKNGDRFRVPAFEILRKERVSPNLLSAIHERLGFSASCRFSLAAGDLASDARCVVLEVSEDSPVDDQIVWIDAHAIEWDCIESDAAREVLWKALAKATAFNTGQNAGLFVRPGWLTEILTWARTSLLDHGVELTGKWSQYNMGPDFALLRLDAVGRDVWFKAVGKPNQREFGITKRLAEFRLPHLPPLLAKRDDWYGWLMFDCGESLPDEQGSPRQWECAARALAELQIESIGQVARILNSGARDLRAQNLSILIDPFLDSMGGLMAERSGASPSPLGREELGWMGKQIQDAISRLDDLGIPDTLGHLDLNPGNIVGAPEDCVFLDWAEACVGHPFFSFQYLLEHSRRAMKPDARWERDLIAAYAVCWNPLLPAEAIAHAVASSPMLAAFAYAVGNVSWENREIRRSPEAAGYLRSLTRRMYHEALRWKERG